MTRTLTALTAAGVAATLIACGGPTHREVDPTDRGLIETDHVGGNEIADAVRDLARKIARQNAKGWPPYIRMSDDAYDPKPVVRIGDITNDTRVHFNTEDIKNEIYNVMTEQNVVYFAAQADDLAQVNQERDYSQAGMTQDEIEYGQEDAVGLLLTGEISDDVINQGDVRQHDYWFNLRLVDTNKERVVPGCTTRTKMRKVREG